MTTLKLRFGSIEHEVPDCKSCQLQNLNLRCLRNLDMAQCATCEMREPRNGDYHNPPLVLMTAPRMPPRPVVPPTQQQQDGSTRLRGLGDVVAKVAAAVGIKPTKGCGCKKRQEALNRLVPFGKQSPPAESQRPAGPTGG